jgi:hypothetical protein
VVDRIAVGARGVVTKSRLRLRLWAIMGSRGWVRGEFVAGYAGMGLAGDPEGRVVGPPVLVGVVGKNLLCSVVV